MGNTPGKKEIVKNINISQGIISQVIKEIQN